MNTTAAAMPPALPASPLERCAAIVAGDPKEIEFARASDIDLCADVDRAVYCELYKEKLLGPVSRLRDLRDMFRHPFFGTQVYPTDTLMGLEIAVGDGLSRLRGLKNTPSEEKTKMMSAGMFGAFAGGVGSLSSMTSSLIYHSADPVAVELLKSAINVAATGAAVVASAVLSAGFFAKDIGKPRGIGLPAFLSLVPMAFGLHTMIAEPARASWLSALCLAGGFLLADFASFRARRRVAELETLYKVATRAHELLQSTHQITSDKLAAHFVAHPRQLARSGGVQRHLGKVRADISSDIAVLDWIRINLADTDKAIVRLAEAVGINTPSGIHDAQAVTKEISQHVNYERLRLLSLGNDIENFFWVPAWTDGNGQPSESWLAKALRLTERYEEIKAECEGILALGRGQKIKEKL